MRIREEALQQRPGRDDLAAGGPDHLVESRKQPSSRPIGRDDDLLRLEVGERLDTRSLAHLHARLDRTSGEVQDEARRLERAVVGMEDPAEEGSA